MCLISGSAVQYKLHAQFLRLFSLHDDVNDAHRAGANRLQNKQQTFVELPDYVPAEFRATHVGKLRKALYVTCPAAASWWEDELRKGLISCNLTVGTVSRCCFHNEPCSVAGTVQGDDIFVAGPRLDISKMGATLKKKWETRDQMIGHKPDDQKELALSIVRCDGARMANLKHMAERL